MSFGGNQVRTTPAQPWSSFQTTAPSPWMLPFIQQGMGLSTNVANDRLAGRGAPPLFSDVTSGRYQSSYGGGAPAGGGSGGLLSSYIPPPSEPITGGGGQPSSGLRDPDQGGGSGEGGPGLPSRNVGLRQPPGGRPGGRPGAGGGGGGRGQSGMGALRDMIARQMVGQAQQPSPALGAGTDFLTSMFSRGPSPMMDRAAMQQETAFNAASDPSSPFNRLLADRAAGGNASTPHRENFIGQLFDRFNTPLPTPGPISGRYDLMSQFASGEPLFTTGGFG